MADWQEVALGQLCTLRAGSAFKRELQGQAEGDYPFIKVSDMNLGRNEISIRTANNWLDEAARSRLKAKSFPAGTTVFAKIGEALKKNRVRYLLRDTLIDNNMMGAMPRELAVVPRYLFYVLSQFDLASTATGTALPYLTVKRLESCRFRVPDWSTQERIAAILSAYDTLIENNLRRIDLIEEMAWCLYREWFVEFRFPGHELARFVDSPLGRIPEGWEVRSLGDAAHVTMGQSPKAEFYNETGDGLPFHQGVSKFAHRFPVTNIFSTRGTRLAEPGDLLFSVRAPVGRINVAACRMILGRGLCGIRHRWNHQSFLFYQLKERFKTEDSMGGGTIFKAVTKGDMLGLPFLVPNSDLELVFEQRVHAADTLVETLTEHNSALREARDLLLPKLVSGDLDVSDLPVRSRPLYTGDPRLLTGYRFFRDIAALPFVEKIVLFGSRARGDHESRSDIDLAVFCDGASDDDWLEILACLREDRIDTLSKVDCVRFDDADSALRENVMTEGVVLYEREGGE